MSKLTPMMKQYFEIKEQYQDYILFFRLGDFYEMFFDDAVVASKALEITLTARNSGSGEKAPLCGVPYHAADNYLSKLVEKGFKVAICEQVEDPATAKGIVKREVVRVVTPGTVIDPNMLDEKRNNYVMTIAPTEENWGIAYVDIMVGDLKATYLENLNVEETIIDEIIKLAPSEIIISEADTFSAGFYEMIDKLGTISLTKHYSKAFQKNNAESIIKRIYRIYSMDSIGLGNSQAATLAAGALLDYIEETQKVALLHFDNIDYFPRDQFMILDKFTRKNLELTETIRSKSKKGTLLWVLDKTSTAMGGRALKQYIEEPLIQLDAIENRHDAVETLYDNQLEREEIKEYLKQIYDLERLAAKLVYGTVNARDLHALKVSLNMVPHISTLIESLCQGEIKDIMASFDPLEDIHDLIEGSILEDPPLALKDGGMIRSEYSPELKELRTAINEGKDWILQLEQREKELTGIKNLKIRFNKVFGYYIEVTKSNLDMVPETYIRKQTLANAERYITPELKDIESKVLGAEEKISKLEYQLFCEIKDQVLLAVNRIRKTGKAIGKLDVLVSFAEVSYKFGYNRPKMTDHKGIEITEGRHPVVERISNDELFVPNDTVLDNEDNLFYIITGPNMAGKSTYLRQVALIVLMAQIGCFVPADKAEVGVVDRIFTRVGASDDLFHGQSTFMVEMIELANILNNATDNSLIILDEIGRGTSTYDGLSIAWAVVEHLSDPNWIGAKTMFATHYHELTELEGKCKGVKNYCISVKEVGDDIVFLHKIIRGGANQSFGIQVAKLAGIPNQVINRAKEILLDLEEHDVNNTGVRVSDYVQKEVIDNPNQLSMFNSLETEIMDELRKIDIMEMTPMVSLNKLYELVQKVKSS